MAKKLNIIFSCSVLLVLLTTQIACQQGGSDGSGGTQGATASPLPSISGTVVLSNVESGLLAKVSPSVTGDTSADYSKLQAKLYDSNNSVLGISPVTRAGTFFFDNVPLGANYHLVITNPSGTMRLVHYLEAFSHSTTVTVNETSTAIGLVIEDARKNGRTFTSQEVLTLLSDADLEKIIKVVQAALVTATGTKSLAEDPSITGAGTKADTIPPTVISIHPASNAMGIATNTIIGIQFSEPMDITTLTSTNITVSAGGANVSGTISISADKTIATFSPATAFFYSTLYTISVTKGVKDGAGNPMKESFSSSFTSVPSPDPTPPAIMNLSIQSVGTQTATILWETDEESSSQVDYGTTTNFGASSPLDVTLTKNHSVILTDLHQRAKFFLKVKSADAAQNLSASTTTLVTLANTASFSKTLSGLDTLTMQIQISGVDPTSFVATATIPCEKASTKSPVSVPWTKTSGIKLPGGIVLVSSTQDVLTVKDFKTIAFTGVIPYGTTVQVYNKDTSSMVASDCFQP